MNRKSSKIFTSDFFGIEPFVWAARFGYAVRGVVFLIVGGLALLAARDISVRPRGIRDTLRHMFDHPFGGFLLWIVASGLVCFAIWRLLQAFIDTERYGRSLYGLTRRAIFACSGLLYLALALTSADIAMGARRVSENRLIHEWSGWLLVQPLGRVVNRRALGPPSDSIKSVTCCADRRPNPTPIYRSTFASSAYRRKK